MFIGLFPLTAMLIKGNNIANMYLKNPLAMLGVVTGGITALITMLIFIINFNVNDIYLGRSKSKVYLEDRVLIQFLKSGFFKFIFFIFSFFHASTSCIKCCIDIWFLKSGI